MQLLNVTRRVVKAKASLGMEQPSSHVKPVSPTVYVYSGPGAGTRCALTARETLQQHFKQHVQVRWLGPEALLSGHWKSNCILLVMPGGADLPYCRLLNGKGNQLIKDYVHGGGSYLGLCAGAYYGAARVKFEVGNPILEVVGDRELCFWPGTARGAAYAGFDYTSERGAVAAPLRFLSSYTVQPHPAGSDDSNTHEQVHSASSQQGRQELTTCRLHVDLLHPVAVSTDQDTAPGDSSAVWQDCVDYCNGGPVFVSSAQQQQQQGSDNDNDEAAIHDDGCMKGDNTTEGKSAQSVEGHSIVTACEPSLTARTGVLYVPPEQLPSSCTVLAHYQDAGPGAVAAVRCQVGAGVAVLCSSHPELPTRWLKQPELIHSDHQCAADTQYSDSDADHRPSCGKSDAAEDGNSEDHSLQEHVAKLVTALDASQTQRAAFLHMLLAACCASFKPNPTLMQ